MILTHLNIDTCSYEENKENKIYFKELFKEIQQHLLHSG